MRKSSKNDVNDYGISLSGALPPSEMEVLNIDGGVVVNLKSYGFAFVLNGTPEGIIKPAQRYNNVSGKWEDLVLLTRRNMAVIKNKALDKMMESDYGSLAWASRGH